MDIAGRKWPLAPCFTPAFNTLLLAMDPGCEGGVLHHGGADITDFSMQYEFKNNRIMTGLTVVEYLLADEGPGDGGM